MKANKIRNYVNLMRNCKVQSRRNELANKIYAELEQDQTVCKTCNDTKLVRKKLTSGMTDYIGNKVPCPDCQKQEDKVAALEIRQLIIDLAFHSQKPNPATIFKKLDVLIDRQAKEIEELKAENDELKYNLTEFKRICDEIKLENASLKEALNDIKNGMYPSEIMVLVGTLSIADLRDKFICWLQWRAEQALKGK